MKEIIDSTLYEIYKKRICELLNLKIKEYVCSYSKHHIFISDSTYPYVHSGCVCIKIDKRYDVYDFYYDYISDKIMDFKPSLKALTYEECFKHVLKKRFVQI